MKVTSSLYKFSFDKEFNESALSKGLYIVVLHATRIPPHIGLMIDGKYNSLTIKGWDINTGVSALVKNSVQRKIPSLFIKIKMHNTFSNTYLKEHFISNVQQFSRVDIGVATCLSPLKLFFEEVYNISMKEVDYLFHLLPILDSEGLIETTTSLFIDEKNYHLPFYSESEINAEIIQVRNEYKTQKNIK